MYDWDDLRYFLALHRHGSLVGAARAVRADPTTVSRRVSVLEKGLGTKLFVRSPDGWTLTPSGQRMLAAAERAEDGALGVMRGVEELQEAPEGRVRLTTIEPLAGWWMVEVFDAVRRQWPGIVLDLITTTRVLDLARGEADIALRVGRPQEPGLLSRRITTSVERPYAHRAWLERTGVDPARPDLSGQDLLVLTGDRWTEAEGRALVRTTSMQVLVRACRMAHGPAVLPDVVAARYPDLVPLDGLGVERRRSVWMVMHPDVARIERVRAVADLTVEHLADR